MPNEFNEQEYRRKLIEGGFSGSRRHRPCRPYRRRSQGLGAPRGLPPRRFPSSCRPRLATPAAPAAEATDAGVRRRRAIRAHGRLAGDDIHV